MIKVCKLNKEEFYLNPALIETIEKRHDTVITLLNGKKYLVEDNPDDILARITEFYKASGASSSRIAFMAYSELNKEEPIIGVIGD